MCSNEPLKLTLSNEEINAIGFYDYHVSYMYSNEPLKIDTFLMYIYIIFRPGVRGLARSAAADPKFEP